MKQINTMSMKLLSAIILLLVGFSANAQLNGTYTVYGAGANYADLESAANALSAGVSGPVTFKIRPGTWSSATTSKAIIGAVSGASSTNTITFEAENGSAATTIIENTSTSSSSSTGNLIFYLNGAKYVRVRNLTLDKTNSTYGTCVSFAGDADYNIIEACVLTGNTGTSTSTNKSRIYGTSLASANNNIIRNNTIDRGSYGIYWYGNSTSSLSQDNEFSDNDFVSPYAYGMRVYYTNNHKIIGNKINTSLSGSFYAIYCYYGDGGLEIKNNTGTITGKTSTTAAMYLGYCDGSSTNHAEVSGNNFTLSTSSTIYTIYNQYCNWMTFDNNKIEGSTTSTGTMYMYPCQYGANNTISNNDVSLNARRGFYFYGVYGSAGSSMVGNKFTEVSSDNASYSYYLYGLYSSNNSEFKNNTLDFNFKTTTSYLYNYWCGYANNSEMSGNDITIYNGAMAGYYTYIYIGYYSNDVEINNNKFDIDCGSGYATYTYPNNYGTNVNFKGNDIDVNHPYGGSTSRSSYVYFYGYGDCDIIGNRIKSTVQSNAGYAYGLYAYLLNSSTKYVIDNNEIIANGGYGAQGLYIYNYNQGNIESVSNNSVFSKAASYNYTFQMQYPYGAKVHNNTIHSAATSNTNYACYLYLYGSPSNSIDFKNNTVTKTSGNSYCLYVSANIPDNFNADYNNYYQPSGSIFYNPYVGTYGTIPAWRAATGKDMNSITYMPGFINASAGDLRPDPTSPASWALNGRGVQTTGNDKDRLGNPRAVTTLQGVPDLGAYEFTPTSTPPDCAMTPAAPPANGTQVVTFGQDTVAVLRWGPTVPTGFAVKQYTGTNPPGIMSINPTQMFYYVDFQGTGSALNYEQDLYFKDPWLGSIASKSALRLAEKVGTNNWSGYAPGTSIANIVRNFISTPSVNDVGALFTGIDVANNASADAIIEPAQPFCPGTYLVKLRIKNVGNNVINNVKIDWQQDGGAINTISHTNPININGSTQGNEAIITLGNITFGSAPVNIKAWTYLPNGVNDPVAIDDTLDKDYFAALSGTYTVGGTNPHFPTVVAAAKALEDYGTCGSVVFNIRPGTYTGQVNVKDPIRLSSATDRVTFQAENGNASSVNITYSSAATYDPTIRWDGIDHFTFRNLTINATGPTYGLGILMAGTCNNDSIEGCNINITSTTLTSYNMSIYAYYNNSFTCDKLMIRKSKLNGGFYGAYMYGTSNLYQNNVTIDSCEISACYGAIWSYYHNGMRITNNKLTGITISSYTGYYGIYSYYARQSPVIEGNRISRFYNMGMYFSYMSGNSASDKAIIRNNAVTMDPAKLSYYPLYVWYPNQIDVVNNTMINNGNSSSNYALYAYLVGSSSYKNNHFYNNVFAHLGGGHPYYVYIPSGYDNKLDYNNIYSSGTGKFSNYSGYASTSLDGWRTMTNQDMHSVTYRPSMKSNTNPEPDISDDASWALNGHGVHIAGNNKDIDGNTRPETRPAGVPDIGAFEITPDVIPPAATAVPATAGPGDLQVFSFAGNEVGRIQWGTKAPAAPVEMRQYSGARESGIAAAAAPKGSMYFYTDVKPLSSASTYDFDFNLDYMEIWLGDIPTDADLRLAHRVTGYPWMVYSGSLSTLDATTNNIDAASLNRFGKFSALENNSVASAFVRTTGSTVICIGNSVQLDAEPKNGDNYKWYRNGIAIPGADGPNAKSYTANQAGDYSVAITFGSSSGNKVVESVPATVSTIAAPNAIIGANKQLTYCVGNGLMLNAGNVPGVTYQWQLNGSDIAGATGSTHNVGQSGNYTVVVSNIGCSTVSAVTPVTSGPLNVTLGNDTSYCEVKNVYHKLDAGYPGAKYLWSTGDTTREIEVRQSGTYKVTVNGGINCIDDDEIVVTIDPLPSAQGISFVQNGNSYQFFPSGAIGATGFMWMFSDGSVSTQQNPTKVINGDLYVRLVMYNACGSDTVQLGWPLSVSNVVDESSVNVYPNPAKDRVTISVSGDAHLQEVEVLNSVGSVVYRGAVSGSATHSVDVSGLANGHYMLRATTTTGAVATRQFDVLR